MKIALVSLYVNSPADAFRFYTEVLGFRERMFVPEANLAIVASPEEPEGTGLLLEPNDNPIASTYQRALYEGGFPAIVFGVADARAEYERLRGSGVVFRGEPSTTEYGTTAVLEDGCGNLVQLHQL
jgi:catechol 2,3-dioxygenase-like lactoylglutathione lyase family enzyme